MNERLIEIRAGFSQDEVLDGQCAIVEERDTLREAKDRAKYYLTKEYQNVIESSRQLKYAQVLLDGDCVADYFAK